MAHAFDIIPEIQYDTRQEVEDNWKTNREKGCVNKK